MTVGNEPDRQTEIAEIAYLVPVTTWRSGQAYAAPAIRKGLSLQSLILVHGLPFSYT